MVWEDFYFLGIGRHVYYRYIAMMGLRHDLIIGQFYIDGGRGSGFLDVLNRSRQWPSVGSTPTIYGRVIMSHVHFGWKNTIRMANIYSRFK